MIHSINQLANKIEAQYLGEDVSISGVQINSKLVKKGDLFVAIIAQRDGHEFIASAVDNGAAAMLVSKRIALDIPQIIVQNTKEALYELAVAYRRSLKMPVISVTGSCGKTTTKEMLVKVLQNFGKVDCSQGNFNNDLGVPMTILSANQDADFLVVEAGTNASGEIEHLAQLIQADIAGITNVSASHLEKLKSLNGVMQEKGQLLAKLSNKGIAIINLDDSRIKAYSQGLDCQKITFSMGKNQVADICVEGFKIKQERSFYQVRVLNEVYQGELQVTGQHNIANAAMVLAIASALELDIKKVLDGLSDFRGYPGRFSLKQINDNLSLINDTYNASVPSVRASIESLNAFEGEKILVLSSMGELGRLAEHYHQEVGNWIKHSAIQHVFLFGEANMMRFISETNKEKSSYFKDKEQLIAAVRSCIDSYRDKPIQVLVKGARAYKMEEVVAALSRSR